MSDRKPIGTRIETEIELDHRVTARTGRSRYRTRVDVRGHVFAADEPPALGGTDLGPTPFDLLCAALASCTTITLRMYADRKEWPLEEVSARVAHSRDKEGASPPRGEVVDLYTVELTLTGDLSDEQRARLVEIAGRCPVHRTLVRSATVRVTAS